VKQLADSLYAEKPETEAYIRAVLTIFGGNISSTAWNPGSWATTGSRPFSSGPGPAFASTLPPPSPFSCGWSTSRHGWSPVTAARSTTGMPSSIPSGIDAHAWDEVWVESRKNWVRVDPTAALLSADRPPRSSDTAAGNESETNLSLEIGSHHLTFSESYLPPWLQGGLREMRLRASRSRPAGTTSSSLQSRNAEPARPGLGFGKENQITLASSPCWPSRPAPPCSASCSSAAGRSPGWKRFMPPLPQHDSARHPRALWEGPLAYTERAAEAFPDHRDAIHHVGSIVPAPVTAPAPPAPPSLRRRAC